MDGVTVIVISIDQHVKGLTVVHDCDPNCDLSELWLPKQTNEQTRLWASGNFMFNGCLVVASVGSAVFVSSRHLLLLPNVIKTIWINTFFKYGVPLVGIR